MSARTPPGASPGKTDLAVLACPACRGALEERPGGAACAACSREYPGQDGLLDLYLPSEGEEAELARRVTSANEAYHDAVAPRYEEDADTREIFGEACQARLRAILARAAGSRGELLVDLGCGTGNVLVAAGDLFDRAVGFDVARGMLRQAAERGCHVHRANVYRLPLADGVAQAVTGFALLHHVSDVEGLLREAHRVLGAGGTLYTDWDPNSRISGGLVRLARAPWLYRPARATYRWLAGAGRDEAFYESAGLEEEFQLSEYHAFHLSSDGERVARLARQVGFRQARVHFHANPATPEGDSWLDLPRRRRMAMRLRGVLAGVLDRHRLYPYFLMLARK